MREGSKKGMIDGGGVGSCGETSPDMKEEDKSVKADAEWKKDGRRQEVEERQKEGGGTAG